MSTQQIKRDAEKRLGRPIPKKVWGYLVDHFFINDIADGSGTIEELVTHAAELMDLGGSGHPVKPLGSMDAFLEPVATDSAADRKAAMSELVASHARRSPFVEGFRSDVLSDGLLDLEQVDQWIKAKAKQDGPATLYVAVPLGSSSWDRKGQKVIIDPPLKVSEAPPFAKFTTETLSYALPDSEWSYSVAVAPGGVLQRLAMLSKQLAKQYTWQEAQATTFVLTGRVPLLSSIRVNTSLNLPMETLSRITITADPTAAPNDVAAAFKKARGQILSGRPRTLSRKHLELILFCDERPDAETWMERMEAWNDEHPNWAYTEPKNFLRDANQGVRRLLGKSFKFTSSKGGSK